MVIFEQRLANFRGQATWQLSLTAEERHRSRHRFDKPGLPTFFLQLPRGTFLQPGDFLQGQAGEILEILAAPEPLCHVTSGDRLGLLKAAYHLGNRHVPLEVTPDYLRLAPDPVLLGLLGELKVAVEQIEAPFFPERGAFHRH